MRGDDWGGQVRSLKLNRNVKLVTFADWGSKNFLDSYIEIDRKPACQQIKTPDQPFYRWAMKENN